MKYKVGDKVRIVSKWTEGCYPSPEGEMDKWLGKVMTIRSIECDCYKMKEDIREHVNGRYWREKTIAGLVNDRKIVITTDGKKTLARLYESDKVIKSAVAKCSPEDDFCFETGAKLAFDRLTGEDKPKYYNGKVVCVETPFASLFTVGKIYTISDGVLIYDNGDILCEYITSFKDIQKCFTSKFVEVIE